MENTASQSNTTIYYIIEHFESELSEWTLNEYVHMIMLLSGLYDAKCNDNRLILTNFPYVNDLDSLIEDDLKTKSHTELFKKINKNFKNKAIVSKYGLEQLTT